MQPLRLLALLVVGGVLSASAAELRGRIVDAEGAAVAGAAVAIASAGVPEIYVRAGSEQQNVTDDEGRFILAVPELAPSQPLELLTWRAGWSAVRIPVENAGDELEVVLPEFVEIEGAVVDERGDPLSDALVAFVRADNGFADEHNPLMFLAPNFESHAVRTGEDGRFIVHAEPGEYTFAARADGFQPRVLADHEIAPRSRSIRIALERGYAIRGRLVRGGDGVAGAHVAIGGGRSRAMPVMTEADGSFVLADLSPGTYQLEIDKAEELVHQRVEAEAPGEIVVELPPAATLRGRVLDGATREPVPQFVMMIEAREADEPRRRRSGVTHRTPAAADGRFEAVLPSGDYRVVASAEGWAPAEPLDVSLPPGSAREIEILLDRGITVHGTVGGEDGSPVSGATVYVVREDPDDDRRLGIIREGSYNAVTDDAGAFSISGLREGPAVVTARKEGFVPSNARVDLVRGERIDLRLSSGIVLSGTVLRGGAPVAGAHVGAESPVMGAEHQTTMTDDDGRFAIRGLLPAHYMLVVNEPEQAISHRQSVDVARERNVVIEIPERSHGTIWGRVSGVLPGKDRRVRVDAYTERGGGDALADEAGNFRIERVPAGVVRVAAQVESRAFSSSSVERLIDLAPGEERRVDLDLGMALAVRGRVTRDGRPAHRARVSFVGTSGGHASAATAEDGSYEIRVPEAGTYRMFIHADEYQATGYQSVREIRGGETIDVDLRERRIEGRVVDARTGQPLRGAHVSLSLAPLADSVTSMPTSGAGEFAFTITTAGEHEILVSADGYGHETRRLRVGELGVSDLVFALEPAEALRVRVTDVRTGMPLDAYVQITDLGGTPLSVPLNRSADGRTTIFSVAPGRYRVTASTMTYGSKTIEATAPGEVEMTLAEGGSLLVESNAGSSVRLTGPTGIPLSICCEPAAHDLRHGMLRVESVEAGRWTVEVLDGDGEVAARATATVRPGELTRVRVQ